MEEEGKGIKLIFLHSLGAGATNIINVAIGLPFNINEPSTIANTFVSKIINFKGKKYQLDLWDTSGREKFRSLTKIFTRDSKIVIFIYDITSKNSFNELEYWIKTAKEVLGDNFISGIIGNKKDLNKEEISEEEAYKFAKLNKMKLKFVSAIKDQKGISDFIDELAYDYLSSLNDKELKIYEMVEMNKKNKKSGKKKY